MAFCSSGPTGTPIRYESRMPPDLVQARPEAMHPIWSPNQSRAWDRNTDMSLLRVSKSVPCAVVAFVLLALPIALAQRTDHEDPNAYPGSWYRISLDPDGNFISGDGHGYNDGAWYYYPRTGWYRQWFYNAPYDPDRKGYLNYEVYVKAVDPNKLTYVEINFNWARPEWSQLGYSRPPLPADAATADQEAKYMSSRRLYVIDNWYIGTVEPVFSHIIEEYNPEWISIDVRGRNAYLFRGAMHECQAKEGACCNPLTGECSLTLEEDCPSTWLWLGPGTTCDACVLGIAGMDFGDAPDTYQTLLANDGARHTKMAGVFLGTALDIDAEGKANLFATGDDIQGIDDEDGVAFLDPLLPGESATIEVIASVAGYLNAWIDFDQDGTFDDTTDQVFSDELLASGLNTLSIQVPATAVTGATFARFRFNTRGLLSWDGLSNDGEVEDYAISISRQLQPQSNSGKGGLLWNQKPQPSDSTTPFLFDAWDERSDLSLHLIAADDWQCENDSPVTGFQWWGSFDGWNQPLLPSQVPLALHITIWTDGSGHPDTLVWEKYCTTWTWNVAGYNNDPWGFTNDTCFQFTCLLSQDQWFHPTLATDASGVSIPAVYWLGICALYDTVASTAQYPWGWTTRPLSFNNGATRIATVSVGTGVATTWPPSVGSTWLSGSPIDSPDSSVWDLAFQLLTTETSAADDSGLAPVYRFWSDKLCAHFYTIDEAEKELIINNYADTWTFEGIAFYAYPPHQAPVGSKPVYRFWSDALGRHFYTISEAERQFLIDTYSAVWAEEGVAWYAFD